MNTSLSQQKKIDQDFLPALQKLIHEEYHYLTPHEPRAQKQQFYDTSSINFSYPEANNLSLAVQQAELDAVRSQIDASNTNTTVKNLYHAKLEEQQKILDILTATTNGDDEAFHDASKRFYGTPDPKLFWVVIKQIDSQFASLIAKIDPKRKTLHHRTNSNLRQN